MLIMRKST